MPQKLINTSQYSEIKVEIQIERKPLGNSSLKPICYNVQATTYEETNPLEHQLNLSLHHPATLDFTRNHLYVALFFFSTLSQDYSSTKHNHANLYLA